MRWYYIVLLAFAILVLSSCTQHASTPTGPPEPPQELLDAVPFAMPAEGVTEAWYQARRLFFSAYMLQLQGELDEALKQYQRSINTFPTAEAYTFLGWTYSWMGRYDDAIREAQRAIALDPGYGNPYNDIGLYLIEQGELDEAIPWLMKAMQAKRYASPHYPWLNLGHIWVCRGEWGKALSCYEEVWRLAPYYPVPSVSVLQADLFLPPEHDRDPGTMAEQQVVKEVITRYFQAWNNYDADTLKDYSDPLSSEISTAVLLRLAASKLAGLTLNIHDNRVLHAEDNMAIVETSISVLDEPEVICHLLRRTNGNWRVVVRLLKDF